MSTETPTEMIEPECNICLSRCWLTARHCIPVVTPCGHIFGSDCIVAAVRNQIWNVCPVCRAAHNGSLIGLALGERDGRRIIDCVSCGEVEFIGGNPLASPCGHIFCKKCAYQGPTLTCQYHRGPPSEIDRNRLVVLYCSQTASSAKPRTPLPAINSSARSRKSSHRQDEHKKEEHSTAPPNTPVSSKTIFDAANDEDMVTLENLLAENCRLQQVNLRDQTDKTALHHAVISMKSKAVKLLLDRGANVDCTDSDNWSPLMYAARNNDIDMVRILLENGASPFIFNNRRQQAFDIATSLGVKALLADWGHRTSNSSTPQPPQPSRVQMTHPMSYSLNFNINGNAIFNDISRAFESMLNFAANGPSVFVHQPTQYVIQPTGPSSRSNVPPMAPRPPFMPAIHLQFPVRMMQRRNFFFPF